MAIIPYRVDVPMGRKPIANIVIIGLTCVLFLLMFAGETWFEPLVLRGWNVGGIMGHVLLHAGPIHVFGNMLFLWVFGNAICAKVDNLAYPVVYLALGIIAGMTHLALSGTPAIGASGAVNGIVGMFLVWYPLNDINCFWIFWLRGGTFAVSSYWMILLWLIFDIWGALSGAGGVAYWAHLGGFAAGFILAVLLLKLNWVDMEDYERSLLDIIVRRR